MEKEVNEKWTSKKIREKKKRNSEDFTLRGGSHGCCDTMLQTWYVIEGGTVQKL